LLFGLDALGNIACDVLVINVLEVEEATAYIVVDQQTPLVTETKEETPPSSEAGDEAQTGELQGLEEVEQFEEEDQANTESQEAEDKQQADGRKNLDLQLEQASRYNFVDRVEQLLDDIKNLFT
jgi:hypothetical protein